MSTVTEKKRRNEKAGERIDKIDFKMVTFSLGGKDYGIDIMKVKEISKAGRFTYVPNSSPFVRGVYNLRGEIISIIDLRIMFHLPAEKKQEDALENILILRLEENIIGVIVDSIDKVIGISSEAVQPPHPIFGDINIKYISGVVENNSRLYIILDVERIFMREKEEKKERIVFTPEEPVEEEPRAAVEEQDEENAEDLDLNFIIETLYTFKRFSVTPVNREWVKTRFEEWKKQRNAAKADLQLKDVEDADAYLAPFFSPSSETLWSEDYVNELSDHLPAISGKAVTVWNPGCGSGYETYSLACLLKEKYKGQRVKIWANDNDLLNISTAPNLILRKDEVPARYEKYVTEGKNGTNFKAEIKDAIMFEYHDILNSNPFEDLDIIFARDILSFQKPQDQVRLLSEFYEKLKPNGILVLGKNEKVADTDGWKEIENSVAGIFIRE